MLLFRNYLGFFGFLMVIYEDCYIKSADEISIVSGFFRLSQRIYKTCVNSMSKY